MIIRRVVLALILVCSMPAGHAAYTWVDVSRIVAIGDVHGAYSELVKLLRATRLVDADLNWVGGDTHLVNLGDLLDRGPDSRNSMDLLMRLQHQARDAGGRVHVLLGNHELMNLTHDQRDVSVAEHASLENIGGHARAFAADGPYGRWLLTLPVIIRINDTLFTHGGLSSLVSAANLASINEEANYALNTILSTGKQLRAQGVIGPETPLLDANNPASTNALGQAFTEARDSIWLGKNGPLWYRGTANCHAILESPVLTRALNTLDASRVVIGHTPTSTKEINSRLSRRVYAIDTGMLKSVYKGHSRALEITSEQIQAISPPGQTVPIIHLPRPDPLTQLARGEYALGERFQGQTQLSFTSETPAISSDNAALTGYFRKLSKRNRHRALAAFRLDRLLGLNFVPATVERSINNQQGIVVAWPNQPFTERLRQQSSVNRPNWCTDYSDYVLLRVFDALIGKTDRSADNLFYEQGSMDIRITENYKAFGTTKTIPETSLKNILPQALIPALEKLTMDNLKPLLQDLLKPKEIEALIERRNEILGWSVSP